MKKGIIESLKRDKDEFIISITIGDLKELIINAMIKEDMIIHQRVKLDDWRIKDIQKYDYKEWLDTVLFSFKD